MKLTHYIRGLISYEITGADVPMFLSRITKSGVQIWNIRKGTELNCTLIAPAGSEKEMEKWAKRCCCEIRVLHRQGIVQDGKKLLGRPLLVIGLLIAILITFCMRSRIWIIDIFACDRVSETEILHALQDLDIDIGMRGKYVEEELLKYRLLRQLPELSWVAVNRNGGRLTVLTLDREQEETTDPLEVAHLVAVSDGVVTELLVEEGAELCKVGDTVKQGQVLVSGLEDQGIYLRGVRAQGEIYGQTWHKGTVILPRNIQEKAYTGRTWTTTFVVVGRKRINLSRNSSISWVLYDKIVDTKQLSLPGYEFPVLLQRETYLEYTTAEVLIPAPEARACLTEAWNGSLLSSMIAGQILETQSSCMNYGGLYSLQAESLCRELLSRSFPIQPPYEGDEILWNESSTQKE